MACIILFINMHLHIDLVPIKRIDEKKKKDLNKAIRVLRLVCKEIGKLQDSGIHHFARPILEAASQNAYQVVSEILDHSLGEALQSTDKNGHDIIQLAIINRSEKIYNLIYDLGEHKNVYRTRKDSYKNNILHLAGKLAPSSVVNRRTGATLQLQRELQWFQEVEKFVFPSYITQENIDKDTPYMIFIREHKELLKEGEHWMKTTAESCSIIVALIVTILFAAAITVPVGNNQEKGTPLFKSKAAFIIFAIADAISLFASSTTLLVFFSILTTCFAEEDFLVRLPWRLFFRIFFLLLSTTTMMVAFTATLFLVFCDNKPWMLAPICGLAFIPVAFFVSLQFPLIVDLLWSTYSPIFGKQRKTTTNIHILVNRILQKLGVWFAR
ncbi:putative PGG domain, ankyrin repeat-containing domain superfamily [Helianthus anomalus]